MTSLMHALYLGDDLTLLALNSLVQITAVILLTMLVVSRFLRRSAAAAHAAWLACLVFVARLPLDRVGRKPGRSVDRFAAPRRRDYSDNPGRGVECIVPGPRRIPFATAGATEPRAVRSLARDGSAR